jgi:hypothetical protein
VRISKDGWAIEGCPDDGPAIAVDSTGAVHVVWPSLIDGTEPQGALFYASTRDGQRFTPRLRVPTLGGLKPAHPQIAVDARGRIFIAWDENIDGRAIAALRELKVQPSGSAAFGAIETLSPDDRAMYPVLAATDRGLVAVWTTGGDPSRVHARIIEMP